MKIAKLLEVIYKVLISLEVLKLIELFVVFSVKGNKAIIPVSVALLAIILTTKRFKKLGLLLVLISNFILIFYYTIVNQHFAYLTCLLTIFALKSVLEKFSLAQEEVERVVALLLIFQLSILYLFAAIWKINIDYFSGMQMLEHLRGFLIFPNQEQPSYVYLLVLSSCGIAVELLLACQFLIIGKTLEFVQAVGFLFHVLLVLMLGEGLRNSFQIFIFSSAALAIYPLCNRKYWSPDSSIVFWDASCSFCANSINIFKKFDVTQNFKYSSNVEVVKYSNLPFDPKIIEDTIVVWDPDSNKYWIKSKAIMYITTGNYFFWFAKPFLYFPFAYKYTDKIYDRVALQRSCNI